MNPSTLIAKKRDGGELSTKEIEWFINGYVSGEVADYQMSAMAMAIYIRGMSVQETADLTESMLHSGEVFTWPSDSLPMADKHSTGGLGDKVSLILAPLLACCGLAVPMISGRGLGATGGTLDKLESIPGFRTDLSTQEMQHVTQTVGCVINGATADLVPADRKLYGLRDVTATVPSIPLITASIMSKKLAEGLDVLVLDVKHGSGAFMKTLTDAKALAKSLVATGQRMGVATSAIITDMNQPLGRMVGNAVEVNESIDCLTGKGPNDLREVTLELSAEALVLAKLHPDHASAKQQLVEKLDSGAAMEKFHAMITAQGGDLKASRPVAKAHAVLAENAGYVTAINAEQIGLTVIELGGGRKKANDKLDLSVGVEMLVRLGDQVESGQPIATLFTQTEQREAAQTMLQGAISIEDNPVEVPSLIVEKVNE